MIFCQKYRRCIISGFPLRKWYAIGLNRKKNAHLYTLPPVSAIILQVVSGVIGKQGQCLIRLPRAGLLGSYIYHETLMGRSIRFSCHSRHMTLTIDFKVIQIRFLVGSRGGKIRLIFYVIILVFIKSTSSRYFSRLLSCHSQLKTKLENGML